MNNYLLEFVSQNGPEWYAAIELPDGSVYAGTADHWLNEQKNTLVKDVPTLKKLNNIFWSEKIKTCCGLTELDNEDN